MSARPSSSMRGRLGTGVGRPPSGMKMGPPGTGRPGTRSGQVPGGSSVFGSGIKVMDRPMTQQGLSGMKGTSKGPQRQIQDRSYWLGEIRTKCSDLTSEINKVEGEIKQHEDENNTFLRFEKRAETLASEIADIQGELHDYNLMIDRVNMNKEVGDMVDDLNSLKSKNNRDAESLERIFEQKVASEKQIKSLENEIRRERTLTENRVQDMDDDMRVRYSNLKRESIQTVTELRQLQDEVDSLSTKNQMMENEMQSDSAKLEAIKLYEKLNDLCVKKDQLEEEERAQVSPEDEQRQLLASVKEHNQEISAMDRQNKESEERIRVMQDEIQQLENELEDQQSESTDKFRQLQKREQQMDEFSQNFDENKSKEVEQQRCLEESIVAMLEEVSKTLSLSENLPSIKKMKSLKQDLQFKEGELQKAESTSLNLQGQSAKLQTDLKKVEEIESKVDSERETLSKNIEDLEDDIATYTNIHELKEKAEQRKVELQEEKSQLEERKLNFRDNLQQMTLDYEDLQREMDENETHTHLANLEGKWQHLEKNNFALKEFIASKSFDCAAVKRSVMKELAATNSLLQELCTRRSMQMDYN